MDRPAKKMDAAFMSSQTHFSRQAVEKAIQQARAMEMDIDSIKRLEKSQCKACFYRGGRLGGAAITHQPCMCCGEDQVYGSTATDALCLQCAKKHDLCKQCGGDRELRERRRKWPEPEQVLEEVECSSHLISGHTNAA